MLLLMEGVLPHSNPPTMSRDKLGCPARFALSWSAAREGVRLQDARSSMTARTVVNLAGITVDQIASLWRIRCDLRSFEEWLCSR
jgi:hypothetical protein